MALCVGIDLVETARLSRLKPAVRGRFLSRVYTEIERQQSGDLDEHLSARFAAKEAVAKALGTGIGEVSWQDIEVRRAENGSVSLCLYRKALQKAEEQGISNWSLSLTHTPDYAMAVVIGSREGNE